MTLRIACWTCTRNASRTAEALLKVWLLRNAGITDGLREGDELPLGKPECASELGLTDGASKDRGQILRCTE